MKSALQLKVVTDLLEHYSVGYSLGVGKDPWAVIEEVQLHDHNITLVTTKGVVRILVDTYGP